MADLVLLPGMDGSGELTADFVSALRLSSKPTIVSYPADKPWGYAELVDYVRSLLPKDRPYVLLAESFSGPVAITIAASNPVGLAALVLVCTFVRCPIRVPRSIAQLGLHAPVGTVCRAMAARLVLGRFSTLTTRTRIRKAVSSLSAPVWCRRLRSVIEADVADRLRHISVPVLCLCARGDRILSRASSVEISRLCPGARTMEIDGPHFLLLCKPDECADAVRAFANASELPL